MTTLDEQIRQMVRHEVADLVGRPEYVHQRSVETVLGLPSRDYLRAAHAGHFAYAKERRLLIARTSDVAAWIERRLVHRDIKPANDASAETIALARVGARRVGS